MRPGFLVFLPGSLWKQSYFDGCHGEPHRNVGQSTPDLRSDPGRCCWKYLVFLPKLAASQSNTDGSVSYQSSWILIQTRLKTTGNKKEKERKEKKIHIAGIWKNTYCFLWIHQQVQAAKPNKTHWNYSSKGVSENREFQSIFFLLKFKVNCVIRHFCFDLLRISLMLWPGLECSCSVVPPVAASSWEAQTSLFITIKTSIKLSALFSDWKKQLKTCWC